MGKNCAGSSGSSGSKAKLVGIILMGIGALVLLLFVPYWVWTSVLSVALISVGFLVWRFN